MNKSKLYLTVGFPGSGKSTWCEQKTKEDVIIHSSDALREELLGDVNAQDKNTDIFTELHRRVKDDLKEGKDVVMDCTNINRKRRMAFLNELKKIPCEKICVFFAVPFEICMERNNARDRVVPEEVMWRMYKSFSIPCKNEGFDDVIMIDDFRGYYGKAHDKIESLKSFDQNNHHHALSLGDHCLAAKDYVSHYERNLKSFDLLKGLTVLSAALLHDVGKEKTKVWHNAKGEPTEEAHYYNHEHVSAYDSLFYSYFSERTVQMRLNTALLIEMHMRPYYTWKDSEKSHQRDKKILGDLYDDLLVLHEADKNAH